MKVMILSLVLLLTGCLGDRIPWDIADVKQSDGAVCIFAPNIGDNFFYERVKIQKAGEQKEFIANINEKKHAKNSCLPTLDYDFIHGHEYNVSFSVIDIKNSERKIYAVSFTEK